MKGKKQKDDKKLPRTVNTFSYQTGQRKSWIADAERTALTPGKRLSVNNKIYWETRENRSDLAGKRI
jgi:hypothetical protein